MRFLLVDRILQLIPGELVRGIKHVTRDDAYLVKDDQGLYCFASALIGESLGQLAAWNVMVSNDFTHRPVAGVVASARLHRPAYVGETLLLESFIDRLDDSAVQYHSIARVGDTTVFTVEGALGPLLPMSRFIDQTLIRQQFAEINRPGDFCDEILSQDSIQQTISLGATPIVSTAFTFDRVLHCESGVSMHAEKRITRAASYFPDHFPNYPVLPMTVLLECKLNLAQLFLQRSSFGTSYRIQEFRKIKMNGFVLPGDSLQCYVNVHHHDEHELILRYRSEVDGKRVCVLDIVMIKG